MARIRTITFLPEIFQTSTNSEFLGSTLDQIVNEPNTTRIQGFVGSKFGYGVNANDYYVVEPTKTRTDYQLTPSVVFTKTNESIAKDFISYPGIIDSLNLEGAITDNNSRLFQSQFYSWDSFTNLDTLVNYDQYYWLPAGAPAVTVAASSVFSSEEYIVTPSLTGYEIVTLGSDQSATNPVITLMRGGTYQFKVDQDSQFWIQSFPGTSGVTPRQPNVSSREVFGVTNNGASNGYVTFNVPDRNAQEEFELGGNLPVDLVSTTPYSELNGALLSEISGIDGITELNDRTVMFYDTVDATDPVYEYIYRISYSGTGSLTTIVLTQEMLIPNQRQITPLFGETWISRRFYRTDSGIISLLPPITATLDVLYYQDSENSRSVGTLRLIDNDLSNEIDVVADILGNKSYTSQNGIVFTNGLKVKFDGAVYPREYLNGEYYVEGVGTAIELVPVNTLVCPERFTVGEFTPWDTTGFDIDNYDIELFLPVEPDYITIARNSISKNAWSRSNRWFHSEVISATARYNNNSSLLTELANQENKAKRPIIEFYPNLKLFNSGIAGKKAVDFFDTRATDALSDVAGTFNYYPDVEVYTSDTAVIASSGSPVTTIAVTVPLSSITGTFQPGMYIGDNLDLLPLNAFINTIDTSSPTQLTLNVSWNVPQTIAGGVTGLVASDTTINNYGIFNGARIVFAADNDPEVRDRIYVAEFATLTPNSTPVIVLTLAEDGIVLPEEMIAVNRGYNYQGRSLYFTGVEWNDAQQKVTVNQAPLFDVFDSNGISFGDPTVYVSTSFNGSSLFSYGIGAGSDDPILGFPVRYSSVGNIGDISFDVTLNSGTFDYVRNNLPVTQSVNTGYVYDYNTINAYVRQTGWQTAIAPSTQYQIFNFDFDPLVPSSTFTCDIAAFSEVAGQWPSVLVYVNNVYQSSDKYTVTTTADTTVITLNTAPVEKTVIQVEINSDQTSKVAYYNIPDNLSNNPFNTDISSVNLGDVGAQYNDIFINSPDTTGDIFGVNNFRDCGNLVPYGTKIIQNSASLVLPGAFLRDPNHNLFDALLFNSREYIKFKQLLVDTVANADYVQRYTPSQILDSALDQITAAKSQINAFFWSDMLPSKNPYRSNRYVFNNNFQQSAIFPLSQVYDFSSANYSGVLVYLSRTISGVTVEKQLVSGIDYTISSDTSSLTISTDLLSGDVIVINEYNQTYGSYVPNTPTKLGIYPSSVPGVVLDADYQTSTYFIKGHDGSYTKLYGQYDAELGVLIDFRDQALLEFETRIYNNLKLSATVPISKYEVLPGFFRESTYSWAEFNKMYSSAFLNWIGQNRIDYKTQYYNRNDELTFNYTNSANKLDNSPIEQGYWRGLYEYLYDTVTPNSTPWEMLGFQNMPTWWTSRYGPAPYTSDNGILWSDLEQGIIWNNGSPYIVAELARPGLSNIIPVDSAGELLSPLRVVVGNYNPSTFQRDWKVGDDGPAELSYRRSSSYPFDIARLYALTRPADFFNLAIDLDNYKFNSEFNQYLVNDRSHLDISAVEVYGNGIAKTSYLNWIVDYEKQQGIDATVNIKTLLENLDVRLTYRLAGYTDKTLVNFYVEKGSPDSQISSLMIPDESYSVLLYDNQPFDQIMFSGVIIQQNNGYWTVYGNSQTEAYFTALTPIYEGNNYSLTVENATVKLTKNYSSEEYIVPYGTRFYSTQEIAQFLMSYGEYLASKGMIFDNLANGIEITWRQMVLEFLYWTQTGWENGSIITLNPSAEVLKLDKPGNIVQPLTLQQQNFILNQNLYPINTSELCISRDETLFRVHTLNDGDTMAYAQFNISNFEHAIVFDNLTLFNDVIYDLVTGLKQNRIQVRGYKTAEWNGTVNAAGFILNQDNVQEWSGNLKYPPGVIVKHKNKYWTPLKLLEPTATFSETDWKAINYDDIQKGLLPNAASRAYESSLYYNVNEANLERDADLLSFSLIGYRPRDYLALADLTDITQINVYKNLIQTKGTRNAIEAFNGSNLPLGGIKYDAYENWAIKSGEYGGVLNQNFVDMRLNQTSLTGNPSIVSLTNGTSTPGSMQEIPLNNLFNYGYPVESPNVLSTVNGNNYDSLYPSAGYANFDDIKMSSYFYADLPNAVNANGEVVNIADFYVGDNLWLANFKQKWDIFAWKSAGQVVQARRNSNGTTIVTFDKPHGLARLDPIAIINFAAEVDGYYIVVDVVNLNEVAINLDLISLSQQTIQGLGLGFKFKSQRVATPAEIASLSLTENEFVKETVWVDENSDGAWAVYRKDISYQPFTTFDEIGSSTYGAAVAYSNRMGYLVADPGAGDLYRYTYSPLLNSSELTETITNGSSFGTTIVHADRLFAVSRPTGDTPTVFIYTLNDSQLSDDIVLYQSIPAPVGVTDWGTAMDISGDLDWLYISDIDNSKVHVYNRQKITLSAGYYTSGKTYEITEVGTTDFTAIGAVENKVGVIFIATGAGTGTGVANQISYTASTIIDSEDYGIDTISGFAKSLTTNRNGNALIIGAPDRSFSSTINNWGTAYAFNRSCQSIEVQSSSFGSRTQTFALAWNIPNVSSSGTVVNSNFVTVSSTTGFNVNDPVVFTATTPGSLNDSGISTEVVYYIAAIVGNTFSLKAARSTSTVIELSNKTGLAFTAYVQDNPLYVTRNGISVNDSNYAVVNSSFVYYGDLQAGDIITVDDNKYVLSQTITSDLSDRTGIQFAKAVDSSVYGEDILIGSPFEIDANGQEGAAYLYTNAGAKYGVVIGESPCQLSSSATVSLNGFLVYLTPGNAAHVANIINISNISNVTASSTSDNKLIIQLIDNALGKVNQRLIVASFDSDVLGELGIKLFTKTQIIKSPHPEGPSQFGSVVKFNESSSIVIAAPVGTRYQGTQFDFTDDVNLDNDTVFDNNATQFVDQYEGVGAVYMYDYLSIANESVFNPGAYAYAQSVNSSELVSGLNPQYGAALDFNENTVVVGAPGFNPVIIGGQVSTFTNASGIPNWHVLRSPAATVDISKIQNAQIFNAITNDTLVNLDYIDPLQNKILGIARENIDYVSSSDPAKYNSPQSDITGFKWGQANVGQIWFNTENVRFVNYHQDDVVYNSKYWGTLFPGSDVAVYTWIASFSPPSSYAGPGVAYSVTDFVIANTINASNVLVPVYYFWVRGTNVIFAERGKTLADSIIAGYIANPLNSGIAYMAPLLPNTFAVYNSQEYINANSSVLHVGFANGETDDAVHNEFALIRENYADDFLPGLPQVNEASHFLAQHPGYQITSTNDPYSLYAKLLDSLSGCDVVGEVVPNPYLPRAVQSGINARPRQSFFYNRFLALKNYFQYANSIISLFPIAELRPELSFLFTSGEFYDTSAYWEYVTWWAVGYDDSTRSIAQVNNYSDLVELNVEPGTLVTVAQNGAGQYEVYRNDGNQLWTRIGLENGTIQFKSSLWDYQAEKLGFGDNFFDTTPFDTYPSTETRSIVRALNEQIFIDELLIYRNKSLMLLFSFIQSEASESQNFLPWLSKTSLVDVAHTIRELRPYETFKSDNQDFLSGYINEVKPYHVVIKDFLFKYTGSEPVDGNVTDFDLPAIYNDDFQEFITPELVYGIPDNRYQYGPDSLIWSAPGYVDWIANYGLSLTGQPDFNIATLKSFISLISTFIIVDNANGFPETGTIRIDDELISYATIDRSLNVLSGLTRGVNGTQISEHIVGAAVIIDLPAIVLYDSGRGYTNIPRVTAVIDTTLYPLPTRPAQLEAVMSGDKVSYINVIDPGQGYVVTPEIVIEPAYEVTFTENAINSSSNTISLDASRIKTGDLVRISSDNIDAVGTLTNNQWYYVCLVESVPQETIALYTEYSDAIKNTNRIRLVSNGQPANFTLSAGARASTITSSSPVRENNIKLRFDRTSYNSKITDWQPGQFYGSYFAGALYDADNVASSSIKLENVTPSIDTILASAEGVAFQVSDVTNEVTILWSSSVRRIASTSSVGNTITLIPLDGNNPDLSDLFPYASGTTLGFYVGMPIKFVGAAPSPLVDSQTYYVESVVSDLEFTVSETADGAAIVLPNATISAQGLSCFTGELIDAVTVSVEYPGILTVTETAGITNKLTVPTSVIGTGGTAGFYTDLPVFFSGNVYGNVVANQVYYITTVVDAQTFTMSETTSPLTMTASATNSSTNAITVSDANYFNNNDPIIFTDITGSLTTSGIVAGQTYYISDIINANSVTISTEINGVVFDIIATTTGSALITNQRSTVVLANATGEMTLNVSLPVSPGQVNGQRFNFYPSSPEYAGVIPVVYGNLIERTITSTLGTNFGIVENKIAMSTVEGDTDFFYVNMPIRVNAASGNLVPGTTYYITEYSGELIPDVFNPGNFIPRPNIQVVATASSSSTDAFTVDSTAALYPDMPIIFNGSAFGGVVIGQQYYVDTIIDVTHFTVKIDLISSTLALSTATGTMIGVGDPYIVVSTSIGGPAVTLATDSVTKATFVQFVETAPEFNVSYVLGGYRATIANPAPGLAVNNTLVILGTDLGGATPANDLTLTINEIGEDGEPTSVICSGVTPGGTGEYYLEVISANNMAVFSDPLLTIPTGINDFPFTGYTIAQVTSLVAATDVFGLSDATGFTVNDIVVFTGNTAVVSPYINYYVYEVVSDTELKITTEAGNPSGIVTIATDESVSFTIAKSGSIALLPQPFYFNESIVRYNNRLYVCTVSNNDDEFTFGKWELINSDDRRLNAMDRVLGYYQPSTNMPGLDLTQLFDGVTYPYSTYKGNAFQPSEQFDVDIRLVDQPFYPSNVSTMSVLWHDGNYRAVSNLPTYSAQISSQTGTDWDIAKLSSVNIGLTSINYLNNFYLVTSQNDATPLTRSINGTVWNSTGYILPYAGVVPTDIKPLGTTGIKLNSVAYANGFWVAVGNNIIRSSDAYNWTTVTNFAAANQYNLRSVIHVDLPLFTGFVACGSGLRTVFNGSYNELVPTSLVLYSEDGDTWTEAPSFSSKGMNSLASDGSSIVAVGDSGVIYYSQNGADWLGINEVQCVSVNGSSNELNVTNTSGFVVNDRVRFNSSFSSITANTNYFIKSIVSATQVTLSATSGGSTLVLNTGSIPAGTFMTLYPVTPLVSLNNVLYAESQWLAVGNSGTVKTSTDILTWTNQASGTVQDLYALTHNADPFVSGEYIATGANNTILRSVDGGVAWNNASLFNPLPSAYDISGAEFTFGYGPEELVPGNITDNMTMFVNTRPGTNWNVVEYGSTGYKVVSIELSPLTEFQVEFSFKGIVKVPVQVALQIIDPVSKLGTTLYPESYTVDWINKTVILDNPLVYSPVLQVLRIDIYEVGNGYQLVKSSTEVDPILESTTSGFNEIHLDCNYSSEKFDGGGVVRSDTVTVTVPITETEVDTNKIFCDSVNNFILNAKVEFEGTPFGNLLENTTYYVKEINIDDSTIIVSETYDFLTGLAGPAYELVDATGDMDAVQRRGNGVTWSTPYVTHNGVKLIPGITGTVVRSDAATDSLVTSSTIGLIPGAPIMFDVNIFGGLSSFTTYYVKTVVNDTSFTISTISGGSVLALTDGTGGSSFVMNDYAFGLQENGISATLIFATNTYTNAVDYLAYSIFGETDPDQYEYTLPEIQYITGDGWNNTFNLVNFVGGTNPQNAIVELDGVRLSSDQYIIDPINDTITFTLTDNGYILDLDMITQEYQLISSPPVVGTNISVLTFNDTRRQYLKTDYAITGTTVSSIVDVDNVLSPATVIGAVNATTSGTNVLTVVAPYATTGMISGQTVTFKSPPISAPDILTGKTYQILAVGNTNFVAIGAASNNVGVIFTATGPGTGSGTAMRTSMGNVSIINTSYFVDTVVSSSSFTIKDASGTTIVLSNDTGYFSFYVNELPTVRITTDLPHLLIDNERVRLDGINGSVELNNGVFYAKIITPTVFDIYERPYVYSDFDVNYPVTGVDSYLSGGFAWQDGQYYLSTTVATQTLSTGSTIVVGSLDGLVVGTPVYFAETGMSDGDVIMGGLIQGTEYYVKEIIDISSSFSVAAVRYGDAVSLTNDTGTMYVSQWAQMNTDRLWVTINGLRVPSSQLYINDFNNLSILSEIDTTDSIIITNMIPTSTPDQLVYLNNVNSSQEASVYSVNPLSVTWTTVDLYDLDVEIYLADVKNVTNTVTQSEIVPSAVDGYYYLGLIADKRSIKAVSMYNVTKNQDVSVSTSDIVLIANAPTLKVATGSSISSGDQVVISIVEGDIIYINGEQISFGTVNFETNVVGNISRGVNGTSIQPVIPKYSTVYAIKSVDRLPDAYYNQTWNSYEFDTVMGDPLQISNTIPAEFLNRGFLQ